MGPNEGKKGYEVDMRASKYGFILKYGPSLKQNAVLFLIKALPLAAIVVLVESVSIFAALHSLIPYYQIPYVMSRYADYLLSTILVDIYITVATILILEILLGILPERSLGKGWRIDSSTRIGIQSVSFAYILISLNRNLAFELFTFTVILLSAVFIEGLIRSGTKESIEKPEPPSIAPRDEKALIDLLIGWGFSFSLLSLAMVILTWLLQVFLPWSFRNIQSVLGVLVVLLASGTLISEALDWKHYLPAKIRTIIHNLLPSVVILIVGFDWTRLLSNQENSLWLLLAFGSLGIYPLVSKQVHGISIQSIDCIPDFFSLEEPRDDQVFMKRIIQFMVICFLVLFLYIITGSRFDVHPLKGLDTQLVWNLFDPCVVFWTGTDFFGFSLLGFILPFLLMIFIITVKTKQWELDLGQDFAFAFFGTFVLSFIFSEITPTGVTLNAVGKIFLAIIAVIIGASARWDKKEGRSLQILAAFWLGMVPADILYALGILNYGFFPDFLCVGGFGWGIADGLMITSLLLMSLAFIISHRKTDEEHHVESKEEEGQRTIIQSGKTRLMRGVFSSMTIPIALFFQFIINIFGVLWIEAAEINYPTGFHLAVLYSFPEVGFLWQALLLGLVISLLLELLEVALTPMFTLNTTAARLTKIAMMVFVSVPFILVRGAGFLTIFSLMLVLSTTFSYAMLVALAEQGLPAMAEDESETYEFERKISPIMTATLTLFATMFFLRMVPYILFTRFANAVILTLIAFLGFGVIVGFTRISGWVILRSFEDSLSARVVDGIKIIILLVIIAEVTWPFLPIFGFAPSAVLMTFGVHKVLSTRWPRRFGTEVIAISSKGAARIFIPNLKAVGLCLFLIITPTLIINESRAFWGPESEISNIRIAVIDDGINTESARFRQHVVAERSFVETIYGYDRDELDPLPSGFGTSHATMIALAILDVFPEASIINARVRSSDDEFRSDAFEAAIRWSINDADASVISLSFGRDEYDIEAGHYDEILSWARERNVFVVASAGNDNLADWAQGGLGTIGYPGASPYVLSAGALNTSGYVDSISSRGPLSNGVIKPDLVAPGYIFENDFLLGTSFAAPRVAAAAAVIIDSLETEGFNWTPGLIAAALVGSAIDLGLQPYVQGAGLFDIEGALDMILDAPRNEENIPILLSVHPNEVPLDFETVFTEVNTTERVTVFCSIPMNISIDIPSSLLGLVSADTVEINQSGTIDLIISAPSSSAGDRYEGTIQFSYGEVVDSANISFEVIHPTARLALDTSHDRRNWYTTYMLYSEYYRSLTEDGICVTELRTQDEFRQCNLSVFDALVVVNPYASWWGLEREFKEADRDKIASYFLEGGNVLFAIDEKTNATAMNLLFNWTGISATGISGRYSLLNATPHPIIEGFDYPLAEEYESRTNYQILNTTANFTSVIYHHQSAMLVCGVFPNRIAAFGASSWFQNKWFGASVKSDIILSMTYWILHLK